MEVWLLKKSGFATLGQPVKNGRRSAATLPWKHRSPLCHPERSPGICGSNARPLLGMFFDRARRRSVSLADVFAPVFQVFLQLGHELACIGTVDDAMIETQGETDDAADGDRVRAVFICNYGRFFKEAADT